MINLCLELLTGLAVSLKGRTMLHGKTVLSNSIRDRSLFTDWASVVRGDTYLC